MLMGQCEGNKKDYKSRVESYSRKMLRKDSQDQAFKLAKPTPSRMLYTNMTMFRDMKDYKSRVESYSREMLRKDSQIKELQGRIETGDGCKYCTTPTSIFRVSLSFF